MTSVLIDLRPAGHFRAAPVAPGKHRFTSGDLVTWTNASTEEEWQDLVVEFVYPMQGIATVRGFFGALHRRTGDPTLETKRLLLSQLTYQGRAADVGAA